MKTKLLLLLMSVTLMSCYRFNGISISPDINTFYVENFTNRAFGAPVDIEVNFSETLRSKIRNESKLKLNQNESDVIFSGDVTSFVVTAEAPVEGNTVALNKLEITVNVKYNDTKNEKNSYNKNFSFFSTFPSDQNLQDVQDRLTKVIFDQIVERIFNDTFTSW